MPTVDIIMPTYNGEKYIRQQIDSIINQSFTNWRLIIRDDKSRDNTLEIINEYKERYPKKIKIIKDDKKNLGVTKNIFELMRYVTSDYAMLSDQDDVWYEQKIEIMLKCIRLKEKNKDIPIMVHSEVLVTDERLNPIYGDGYKSYLTRTIGKDGKKTDFVHLLFVNVCQGATMILNKGAIEEIQRIDSAHISKNVVHDSAIASIVSIRGKIYFYSKPLVYYRQHDANLIGGLRKARCGIHSWNEEQKEEWRWRNYLVLNRQKCIFLKRNFGDIMSKQQKEIIDYYLNGRSNIGKFFRLGLKKYFTTWEIVKGIFLK